jgi:hypothetical protein
MPGESHMMLHQLVADYSFPTRCAGTSMLARLCTQRGSFRMLARIHARGPQTVIPHATQWYRAGIGSLYVTSKPRHVYQISSANTQLLPLPCSTPPPSGHAHHLLLHTAAREAARASTERRRKAAERCCKALLKAGANAAAMDGCGLTALQWHMLEVRCCLSAGRVWHVMRPGCAVQRASTCTQSYMAAAAQQHDADFTGSPGAGTTCTLNPTCSHACCLQRMHVAAWVLPLIASGANAGCRSLQKYHQ